MLSPLTSEHEPITEPAPEFKKFRIVLIKPSKYDDEGYVIRFWKGVLPSNTLNVLHGLTEAVNDSGVLGDLRIEIVTFDETTEKLPVKKIMGWSRHPRPNWSWVWSGSKPTSFPGPWIWGGNSERRGRCPDGRLPHQRDHQHAVRAGAGHPGADPRVHHRRVR